VFAKLVYRPTVGPLVAEVERDRNGRWPVYEGFENLLPFRDGLPEVMSDPTGIFFG
jgi:hypothetical protein